MKYVLYLKDYVTKLNTDKKDTTDKGKINVIYTWYNLDYSPDLTEVWDDGEFTSEDIGKTVFDSLEEYEKAFPEDFQYDEIYVGDELRLE